jgi:large subunit ribosomal protein L24
VCICRPVAGDVEALPLGLYTFERPGHLVHIDMNSSLYLSGWGRRLAKKLMSPAGKHKSKVDPSQRWNIVKGDKVQVIQGPQTGQRGTIIDVIRASNRVVVEGCNMRRRIVKPKMDGTPGKLVTKPCSIHYSNVMLIDPVSGYG